MVWIWALIPVTAILAAYFFEFLKEKQELQQLTRQNKEDIETLQRIVFRLKNRVENLEAIEASSPDIGGKPFERSAKNTADEYDLASIKEENEHIVAKIAKRKRGF